MKNKILGEIIHDTEIMKALIIHSENFIDIIPSSDEQLKLNEPQKLIRKQIFPYKSISLTTIQPEVYITMMFSNFTKKNNNFISGSIQFFIVLPSTLEKTIYGSRYDFIGDRLEEIFNKTGIGVFEFKGRGDIDFPKDDFQCHMVRFDIIDFHIRG